MPRRCSVFGCRSNYDGEEPCSTFSLPNNNNLRALWLRKIPTDFSRIKNPVVCIKHFPEQYIISTSTVTVNGEVKVFPRERPKLTEEAVPTIFPNTPKYLSTAIPTVKRLADVEEEKLAQAINDSIETQKQFVEKDTIHNFSDIVSFLLKNRMPNGRWTYVQRSDVLYLCYLCVEADTPNIHSTVVVNISLEFEVFCDKVQLSASDLPVGTSKLNSYVCLETLLDAIEAKNVISKCENKLEHALSIIKSLTCYEEQDSVKFLVSQLALSGVPKSSRRYCNLAMLLASCMYVHSPSAYIALRKCNLMYLPHPRTLQKLIYNYNLPKCSNDSLQYLSDRFSRLQEYEHLVCIQMDEIYVHPELSFKGGQIYGANSLDAGTPAKTAQVFMVSSIVSKYRDVVCIVPVCNMKGDHLKSMILSVLGNVERIGFRVVALISDNNTVNRRAYQLLSPNNILEPCIVHPLDSNRKLFFIFDTVHILKSIRNNWQSKGALKTIKYPDWNDQTILVSACFKDLEVMYEKEKSSLVKYGHTLSLKALYPSSVQKQNLNLALKVFNENNVVALKQIAKDYPTEFRNVNTTCLFIDIFVKWWKVVNVKSVSESERFNDPYRQAIKSTADMPMQYLKFMLKWLQAWRTSVPASEGLSAPTFQSLTLTIESFLKLIPYVLEKYSLKYVLLAKLQSDNLESRFSSYRQLSGANYYIRYMQILESERKLRFKNDVLFCVQHEDVHFKTIVPSEQLYIPSVEITPFTDVLQFEFTDECVPHDVVPILTYIAGFAVMKALRVEKCDICFRWLQLNKEVVVDASYDFVKELDRGKLVLPTETAVRCMAIAWHTMQQLTEKCKSEFLNCGSQLSILQELCCRRINQTRQPFFYSICDCKKTLLDKLQKLSLIGCKILINNFVKGINDVNIEKCMNNRKIKKLKSV